jgi:hypothetical protein
MNVQSAVIWMRGPVTDEEISSLSSLIHDFEQELDIKLHAEEPTRMRGRLSFSSVTQVDLRSMVLNRSNLGPDPDDEYERETVTRRLIPLPLRSPDQRKRRRHPDDGQVHLLVDAGRFRSEGEPVSLVFNLSRPDACEVVVTRIAGVISRVFGPECSVRRLPSPDSVYLEDIDELRLRGPHGLTGRWFAQGLAAERELALLSDAPPPPLYGASLRCKRRKLGTRLAAVIVAAVLVFLGLSFVRTRPIVTWIEQQVDRVVELVPKR